MFTVQLTCMPVKSVETQTKEFALWLKQRMAAADIKYAAELARRSKVSPQSLSRILDPKPLPDTGKYHLPRRDTVLALAHPLGVAEAEILEVAGYGTSNKPVEEEELAVLFAGYPKLDEEGRKQLQPILRMVAREMEAILAKQASDNHE